MPPEFICKLIKSVTDKPFDNCWTRNYDNDDWPFYRDYPVMLRDGAMFMGDSSEVAQNVYVSLVLTKEEFLKINPNIQLVD